MIAHLANTSSVSSAPAFTPSLHERRQATSPRNCLKRVASLLCEFAPGTPGTQADPDLVPLPRERIAEALGINLCKVKRTLALLSLSQVIACERGGVRVLDWRRLAAAAGHEITPSSDVEHDELMVTIHDAPPVQFVTASGDQAYFA